MVTNGIKSANQVQFQDANGVPTVPVVGEKGGLMVEIADGESININRQATTLISLYEKMINEVGSDSISIPDINDKMVNVISVANYSKDTPIIVGISFDGTTVENYRIGPNIAVELPINKEVKSGQITPSPDNVDATFEGEIPVQLVVKGVK